MTYATTHEVTGVRGRVAGTVTATPAGEFEAVGARYAWVPNYFGGGGREDRLRDVFLGTATTAQGAEDMVRYHDWVEAGCPDDGE